jgi:PPOX class probable F420-dependent enzyme
MASMTDAERAAFLAEPRYGILSMLRRDGAPLAVPVWFEWDGKRVRMFSSRLSLKIKRLQRDPRASLLVTNRLEEQEAWVAFDGEVEVREEGGLELAERLAPRYWDLDDEHRRATLELWRKAAGVFVVLELVPSQIRSYQD